MISKNQFLGHFYRNRFLIYLSLVCLLFSVSVFYFFRPFEPTLNDELAHLSSQSKNFNASKLKNELFRPFRNLDINALRKYEEDFIRTKRADGQLLIGNLSLLSEYFGGTSFSHPSLVFNDKSLNQKLQSHSSIESVEKVIFLKLNNLQNLVKERSWRTLTRLEERTRGQLEIFFDEMKASHFSWESPKRMKKSVLRIQDDLERIVSVTENSTLTDENKTYIKYHLDAVSKEFDKLLLFTNDINELQSRIEQFIENAKTMNNHFKNEVYFLKDIVYKTQNVVIFSILIACSFLILYVFMHLLRANSHYHSFDQTLKTYFLQFIKDSVLPESFYKSFSVKQVGFHEQIDLIKRGLSKRISLGADFESSLPFPSCILDSNLCVAWSNPSFNEAFNIELSQQLRGIVTWDYILGFSNIDDQTPILDALEKKCSGVYQVQLRFVHQDEGEPYEMYVHALEGRVFVFFYPLKAMQRTIEDQVSSVVNPLKKYTNLLLEGEDFDRQKIKREFEVGNISDLYVLLSDLESSFLAQVDEEKEKSLKLENELGVLQGYVDEVSKHFGPIKKSVLELKEKLIIFSEEKYQSDERYHVLMTSFHELESSFHRLSHYILNQQDDLKTLFLSFHQLGKNSKEFKEMMKDFSYEYEKMVNKNQNLNSSLMSSHITPISQIQAKIETSLSKVRLYLEKLDLDFKKIQPHLRNNKSIELFKEQSLFTEGNEPFIDPLMNLYKETSMLEKPPRQHLF